MSTFSLTPPDEFVYWAARPMPRMELRIIDNIQYLQPRQYQVDEAAAIQATSYGLLVYTMNNYFEKSIPIMKWLQTQRNKDGGFASSQVQSGF